MSEAVPSSVVDEEDEELEGRCMSNTAQRF